MNDSHVPWLTLVSRRGAGVWTHLPSILHMATTNRSDLRPILVMDFGLRHEMLNHFSIDPSSLPASASICGAMATGEGGEYGFITLADLVSRHPDDYCRRGARLDAASNVILVPLSLPGAPFRGVLNPHDLTSYSEFIDDEVQANTPRLVIATFEGQPEGVLFERELERQALLRFAIDRADFVICLVRHDTNPRFEDGISIPQIIGRRPSWRNKVRIVLTRTEAKSPFGAPLVLGWIPFAECVANSISRGRVALLDEPDVKGAALSEWEAYCAATRETADVIMKLVGGERP